MYRNLRTCPGAVTSLVNVSVGLVFTFIGVWFAIPAIGPFGYLWTLCAVSATLWSIYNAFTVVSPAGPWLKNSTAPTADDMANRLQRLEALNAQRLLTSAEYAERRAEILNEL